MSETKWSPGEWTMGDIEEGCKEAWISIYAPDGKDKLIADVWLANPDSTVTPEEGKANAELIIAAKKLFNLVFNNAAELDICPCDIGLPDNNNCDGMTCDDCWHKAKEFLLAGREE